MFNLHIHELQHLSYVSTYIITNMSTYISTYMFQHRFVCSSKGHHWSSLTYSPTSTWSSPPCSPSSASSKYPPLGPRWQSSLLATPGALYVKPFLSAATFLIFIQILWNMWMIFAHISHTQNIKVTHLPFSIWAENWNFPVSVLKL